MFRIAIPSLCLCLFSAPLVAEPATYRGLTFEAGDISFADKVAGAEAGDPAASDREFTDPAKTLGPPDYRARKGAYSLGNGGSVTLAFEDNALYASGDERPDLAVFEIGSGREDSFAAVSPDGGTFIDVGLVEPGATGLDIDPALRAAGIDAGTAIRFVRLTDEAGGEGSSGRTAGADIDAVAAFFIEPQSSGTRDSVAEAQAGGSVSSAAQTVVLATPQPVRKKPSPPQAMWRGHWTGQTLVSRLAPSAPQALELTWTDEGAFVDFVFDPENFFYDQSSRSSYFPADRYAETRCTVAFNFADRPGRLDYAYDDCPVALGLDEVSIKASGAYDKAKVEMTYDFAGHRYPARFYRKLDASYALDGAAWPKDGSFDLAGASLRQNVSQIRAAIEAAVGTPAQEWQSKPVTLTGSYVTHYVSDNVLPSVALTQHELSSDAMGTPHYPVERFRFWTLDGPDGEVPVAVLRIWTPTPEDAPAYDNVGIALVDKYGKASNGLYQQRRRWAFNRGGRRVGDCRGNIRFSDDLQFVRLRENCGLMLQAKTSASRDDRMFQLELFMLDHARFIAAQQQEEWQEHLDRLAARLPDIQARSKTIQDRQSEFEDNEPKL